MTGDARLHVLNKAPDHPRSQACLAMLQPGDAVILLENAVLATTDQRWDTQRPRDLSLYAMRSDCAARGITENLKSSAYLIDYADFVAIVCGERAPIWW